MDNTQRAADILTSSGCYVNTSHAGEPPIALPDGSTVPVYLSCRRLISYPAERAEMIDMLTDIVKSNFPDANLIVGVATAGIVWAHGIASQLNLPLAYVRSSSKGYGLGKLVEGDPAHGSRAVIVDDVLYTGKSIKQACEAIKNEKAAVVEGIVGIASLNGKGAEEYRNAGYPAVTLTTYNEIVDSALQHDVINNDEATKLKRYYSGSGIVI